jgi:beta-xylosidase
MRQSLFPTLLALFVLLPLLVVAVLSPAPQGAPSAAALPAGAPTFANPVINTDFPDPDLLKVGDTWYLYATNGNGRNVRIAQSTDLVSWTIGKDAMPKVPRWASSQPGFNWAPEVTTFNGGQSYVMYLTMRDVRSNKQCIGLATSVAPEGPFTDTRTEPFVCQPELGGDIDAATFTDDDGAHYLLWKNDGNCCGQDTWLHIQRLAADGLALEGEPTRLLKQDQPWEGQLIEAPTLWKHEGVYYLFYSANAYYDATYAIGYATATAVTGPYTKAPGPWAFSRSDFGEIIGPGGQDLVIGPAGGTWLLYHAWEPDMGFRRLSLDPIRWEAGVPVLERLTSGVAQALP